MRLNHVYLMFARFYRRNAAPFVAPWVSPPKVFKKCQTEKSSALPVALHVSDKEKEKEEEKRVREVRQLTQPIRLMSLSKFKRYNLGLLGFF